MSNEHLKLSVGDKIKIHGWVMMEGLEDGATYTLIRVTILHGRPTYSLRQRGKKKTVRHYAASVDGWISDKSPNLSWIEKLTK